MHNEISPGLYLGAAVLMINAPLAGKLFHWRQTRREEDAWNISLRPFLIIIIIIISSLLPYLSCYRMLDLLARGRGWHLKVDFMREKWARTKRETDNRELTWMGFLLWLLSFIWGFVCFIIAVVFHLKSKIIDASICGFWFFSLGIYFCMCSFVFIESLSARISMISLMQIASLTIYAKNRIILLLCNSLNIITSLSWLVDFKLLKGLLKKNNKNLFMYCINQCLILSRFSFKEWRLNDFWLCHLRGLRSSGPSWEDRATIRVLL